MIITFTFQGSQDDLPAMQKAIEILGPGTVTVRQELAPVKNGAAPAEPVRRRRRTKAEMAAAGNGEDDGTDVVIESEDEAPAEAPPEAPVPATNEITDEVAIGEVRSFCQKFPKMSGAVNTLLREFGAERVSQVKQDQRVEFLSQLQSLAALS